MDLDNKSNINKDKLDLKIKNTELSDDFEYDDAQNIE